MDVGPAGCGPRDKKGVKHSVHNLYSYGIMATADTRFHHVSQGAAMFLFEAAFA